jgi:hypothetical protein
MTDNTTITAVDGTDALAFVIIRPGKDDGGVAIEAAASGVTKEGAAYVLRRVANQWDGGGGDPSAILGALNTLAEKLEDIVARAPRHPRWLSILPLTFSERFEHDKAVGYFNAARAIRHVLSTGLLPDEIASAVELPLIDDEKDVS